MAVPKYDEMMVPVLRRIAEEPGAAVTSKQLRRFVIDHWGLSDIEVAERVSSGVERYANNMLWACTHLKQAKCIESPKRGTYLVTQRGLDLLNSGVEKLDRRALMQFPEFCDFLNRSRKGKDVSAKETEETVAQTMAVEENESPEDTIDEAFRSIETALVSDILEAC
ncbi:winged helix-turn-helix domain-containing protein [uncultured Adlercreutzia sp.]|uniref:winged helix-turn-helix domain-containing protein n=1 Tax=uncultured Adlercreutzia sp. TaxID=875803 RepID=UPI00266581F7|nr:winged helix-turn-helix domain-containing protein [uncultured Adlercreutzia sp.]